VTHVCTISPNPERLDIDDSLTIDGYTQGDSTTGTTADDATENTLAFGMNAVLKIVLSGFSATPPDFFNGVDGFDVEAGPTTIRGLVINGPASTGNIIGGATPAARNLIGRNGEQGVEISASAANTVQGNLIGTKGTTDLGNTQDGSG
jgi:hypothetical protein